jgi:nicotinamide phosphoribosyltransferase
MRTNNLIHLTDSYKVTHAPQYPKGTSHVFSFFESRGGVYRDVTFFGLQYFLKKYLVGQVITEEDIREGADFFGAHFGNTSFFNERGWRHILEKHGGRLPVEIRAIPEGVTVPYSNAMMTVENTDPQVPWLTNYLESLLSQVWYPSTVATQSRQMKKIILASLKKTGTPDDVMFKLHDFGFRGSTSVESAALGGGAHLINFMGTDTMAALSFAHTYYGELMAGFSVPASEHSTMTSWGKDHEVDAFRNMLEQYPTGLVSVVSDSYDIFHACRELWGGELKEQVLMRDGTLVVRPDSGNPSEVVPKVLSILGEQFGFEVNAKGYKVLNPKVRVIQGDGIDSNSLGNVLTAMEHSHWSADNIVFGSGGGLLQKVNRDTQKFAFKCSAVKVDGVWRDVMKDPVTDSMKRSKAGRLALIADRNSYRTVSLLETRIPDEENLLRPVFRNGELLVDQTFREIRARAAL